MLFCHSFYLQSCACAGQKRVRILAILDLGTLFTKPKIAPKTFKCSLVTVFTCDAAHVQVRILAFLDFSTTETRHYIILKGWSLTWNQSVSRSGSRSDGEETTRILVRPRLPSLASCRRQNCSSRLYHNLTAASTCCN